MNMYVDVFKSVLQDLGCSLHMSQIKDILQVFLIIQEGMV